MKGCPREPKGAMEGEQAQPVLIPSFPTRPRSHIHTSVRIHHPVQQQQKATRLLATRTRMRPFYLCALGAVGVSAWGPGWDWGGPGSDNDGGGGPFGSSSWSSSSSSSSSSSGGPFGAGSSNFQMAAGFDYEQAMSYSHIHGVLAAVAFVGFFPVGAILMRAVPGRFAWVIHALAQVLGYLVFVAAAALGLLLVRMVRLPGSGQSLVRPPPVLPSPSFSSSPASSSPCASSRAYVVS